MKTKKISLMFLAATVFSIPTISHASPSLECDYVMPSGQYTGHLIDIIDKDGWPDTNYMFQSDDQKFRGCVQINSNSNPVRAKIVYNEYLLGSDIAIDIDTNHNIIGIGD